MGSVDGDPVLLVAAALGRDMLMAAPGTWEVLRFCFSGGGRTSLGDGVAVFAAWAEVDVGRGVIGPDNPGSRYQRL